MANRETSGSRCLAFLGDCAGEDVAAHLQWCDAKGRCEFFVVATARQHLLDG
jgi:hypothetical protein